MGKNSTWRIILAAVAAFLCVACAVWLGWQHMKPRGERGPTPLTLNPEDHERIVSERRAITMMDGLNLSDDQLAEVTIIIMALRKQIQKERESGAGSIVKLRAARTTLMNTFEDQVMAVLTQEQQEQFKQRKADVAGRLGQLRQFRQQIEQQTQGN